MVTVSWELCVPDNDDLPAKSSLSVAAVVKTYFLNVLETGVPFDFKDSIAEAAIRFLFSTAPSEVTDNRVSAVYDRLGCK